MLDGWGSCIFLIDVRLFVRIIVAGNRVGKVSLNPRRGYLLFTWERHESISSFYASFTGKLVLQTRLFSHATLIGLEEGKLWIQTLPSAEILVLYYILQVTVGEKILLTDSIGWVSNADLKRQTPLRFEIGSPSLFLTMITVTPTTSLYLLFIFSFWYTIKKINQLC